MQDLKLDEKMVASKEAISRTWVTGSSKVRVAVGSAWAGLDQYRVRKPEGVTPTTPTPVDPKDGAGGKEEVKGSFVGGWTAWAAEKRKKAFAKEEPVKREAVDIGPAPSRPLAQWAKRGSDASSTLTSPRVESVRSSTEKSEMEGEKSEMEEKTDVEESRNGGMDEVKLS
jgi:hypothetical protein